MKTKSYNGWTNYPTWAVNQWLTNDNGICDEFNLYIKELVEPIRDKTEFDPEGKTYTVTSDIEIMIYDLADAIKVFVKNNYPVLVGLFCFHGDLLHPALESINYHEIAESVIENF